MNESSHQVADLDHPTACLNAAIRRSARAISNAYDMALAQSGLSGPQFTLLTKLTQTGPVPIKTLAAAIGIDRTTLSRTLQPLVSRGLLREQTGEDRRVKRISITPRGAATRARAETAWRVVQQAAVDSLGSDQAEEMLLCLTALERAGEAAQRKLTQADA